jgi:hypothetical protein
MFGKIISAFTKEVIMIQQLKNNDDGDYNSLYLYITALIKSFQME